MRFHHTTQNGIDVKFTNSFWNFPCNIFGLRLPGVTETRASETVAKRIYWCQDLALCLSLRPPLPFFPQHKPSGYTLLMLVSPLSMSFAIFFTQLTFAQFLIRGPYFLQKVLWELQVGLHVPPLATIAPYTYLDLHHLLVTLKLHTDMSHSLAQWLLKSGPYLLHVQLPKAKHKAGHIITVHDLK